MASTLMRRRIGWRALFLVLALVTAHFFVVLIPEAHAWHISVNPPNNHVGAGGKVVYTVSVDYDPGEVLGFVPLVQLITDPIAGLTITFSPETHVIPFTSTMTVQVDSSFSHPGPLTIHVYAHLNPGSPFPGPDDKVADVGLVVFTTPTVITTTAGPVSGTDWVVLSVGLSPANPQVGDAVTLSMDMTALSSSMSFPQDVVVECQIDPPASSGGTECFFGTVTFPGPTGQSFTVTSKTPWATTPGTHTLMWDIATTGDSNPGNNGKTISFTVVQATATFQFDYRILVSPSEQSVTPGASAVYAVSVNLIAGPAQNVALSLSGPADMMAAGKLSGAFNPSSGKPDPTFSSTLTIKTTSSVSPGRFSMTVTGSGGGRVHTATFDLVVLGTPTTVTPPQTSTTIVTTTGTTIPPPGPSFPDLTWIIIGILVVLIVIFAAFALRGRQPAYQPPPMDDAS